MNFEFDRQESSIKVTWGKGKEQTFIIQYKRDEYDIMKDLWKQFDEEKAFSRKLHYLADIFNRDSEVKDDFDHGFYRKLLVYLMEILWHYNWSSPFIKTDPSSNGNNNTDGEKK